MDQETKQNPLHKIRQLLKQKQFQSAEELLKNVEKDNTTVASLIYVYKQIQFNDEDEYEKMLHLISICLSSTIDYNIYKDAVSAIINQIVGLSSLKYSVVILRGFLFKLEEYKFSKFIILSHLYLYTSLLFDPTLEDIKNLLIEFKQLSNQIIKEEEGAQNLNAALFKEITLKTHRTFLKNVLEQKYKQVNENKFNDFLEVLSICIKQIQKLNEKHEESEEQNNYHDASLQILSKFSIPIDKHILPLNFSQAIYQQYFKNDHKSYILSEKKMAQIMIKTLCFEIPDSLNAPPEMNNQSMQSIYTFILFISKQLKKQNNFDFINSNFALIENLIEKVNIFLGCINPEDPSYKKITKQFIPLTFLMPESRQTILAKLINKHSNINFKSHLIGQYRKLITFKTSKAIWLRSTSLLFKQIQTLEPNSSIDFIGHILSFCYYWKAVSQNFISQQKYKQTLHINMNQKLQQFNQLLTSLKKGLETRPQLPHTTDQQKNQISVCLFRLEQLLNPTLPFETKNS